MTLPVGSRWFFAVFALAVLARGGSADDKDRGDKARKIHGRVVKVQPEERRLVLDHRGKEMTFQVDKNTLIEAGGKEVGLGDVDEGARVKVLYEKDGDQYRALSVRVPTLGPAVGRAVQQALAAARRLGAEHKDEYQKKLNGLVQQLDDQIDDLKEKAAKAQGEARRKFDQEVGDLERKRDEAEKKLAKMKAASGPAWEDLKGGMQDAIQDLQKAIERAKTHFDEKKEDR